MATTIKPEYQKITDLYFAVWDMAPPYNYIWVDFAGGRLSKGTKKIDEDPIKTRREANPIDLLDRMDYVELISYDEQGRAMLGFEQPDSDDGGIPANRRYLDAFLRDLQDIDILAWREQYPSMRDGLCWRIDIYTEGGEKHMSGQTRFPQEWAAFGRAMAVLIDRVESGQ